MVFPKTTAMKSLCCALQHATKWGAIALYGTGRLTKYILACSGFGDSVTVVITDDEDDLDVLPEIDG